MKKLLYLTMILFAMVLINTSCDDETVTPDTPTETPIISLDELAGYWNFVSVEYNNKTYYTCEDVANDPNSGSLFLVEMNIDLTTNNEPFDAYCDWLFPCTNNGNNDLWLQYYGDDNEFQVGNDVFLKVLEYNKTTNTLKAQMIEPEGVDYLPIGAVYTWQKN